MSRTKATAALACALVVVFLDAAQVLAQAPAATGAPAATQAAPPADSANPDRVFKPAQPEFTTVNLPTTLRLPKHAFAFRVTHRFIRDLADGSFGDLAGDFFALDSGAQIGLELRYGLMSGWQVGIYRTSDKTIELFTQYNVLSQAGRNPFSVDALATLEGTNNLKADDPGSLTGSGVRSPSLGAVVSHLFGKRASINLTAAWINNTNPLPADLVDHNDTGILGVGGRLRILSSVYVVGEIVPRIGGDKPGTTLGSFAIEKRAGGHAFQLNFSNGIGSTLAQVARGAASSGGWHLGFNINRKFF